MIYRTQCPACRGSGEVEVTGQLDLFGTNACRPCKGSGIVTLCKETLEPFRPYTAPMHDVDPEVHADAIQETLAYAGID